MIYASDSEFVADFVKRTKYNYILLEKSQYNVTQLINSAIGLLIVPKESVFSKSESLTDCDDLLLKMESCIIKNTYKNNVTVLEIARHLRNGIAHWNMEFKAEKDCNITSPINIDKIIITDHNKQTNETFKIELTVSVLHEFLFKYSDMIIQNIELKDT